MKILQDQGRGSSPPSGGIPGKGGRDPQVPWVSLNLCPRPVDASRYCLRIWAFDPGGCWVTAYLLWVTDLLQIPRGVQLTNDLPICSASVTERGWVARASISKKRREEVINFLEHLETSKSVENMQSCGPSSITMFFDEIHYFCCYKHFC